MLPAAGDATPAVYASPQGAAQPNPPLPDVTGLLDAMRKAVGDLAGVPVAISEPVEPSLSRGFLARLFS